MKYIVATFMMLALLVLSCKSDIKHNADSQNTKVSEAELIEQGKAITSATYVALSSELQKAMKSGGVKKAVNYCNVAAMPLTDSLAMQYGVDIKRTSDKVRNSENKASKNELAIIQAYNMDLKKGKVLSPKIVHGKDSKSFYAPIIINDLCLKCHGQKAQISEYSVISELYPNDLATGYTSGDLRGIWSVTFRN